MIDADRIIYVPAAISPHKLDHPPLDSAHRVAMLKLAIKGLPDTVISTIEIDREGPSLLIGSPMCKAFSQIRTFNKNAMDHEKYKKLLDVKLL